MTRIVLYTPFPELTRREYQGFIPSISNQNNQEWPMSIQHTGTGLPLAYWPSTRIRNIDNQDERTQQEYNNYIDNVIQLSDFKKTHNSEFLHKYKGKGVTIVDVTYPTNVNGIPKPIFVSYTKEDILLIHAHGNTDVIGTGSLVLTAELLAQHLELLGLSKNNSPTVVVWACNSGATDEDFDESYAQRLQTELRDKGFEHIDVIGIAASIYVNQSEGAKAGEKIWYAKEQIDATGKVVERIISQKEATRVHVTPSINRKIQNNPPEGGLYTISKQLRDLRQNNQTENVDIAPPNNNLIFSHSASNLRIAPRTNTNSTNNANRDANQIQNDQELRRSTRVRKEPDRYTPETSNIKRHKN